MSGLSIAKCKHQSKAHCDRFTPLDRVSSWRWLISLLGFPYVLLRAHPPCCHNSSSETSRFSLTIYGFFSSSHASGLSIPASSSGSCSSDDWSLPSGWFSSPSISRISCQYPGSDTCSIESLLLQSFHHCCQFRGSPCVEPSLLQCQRLGQPVDILLSQRSGQPWILENIHHAVRPVIDLTEHCQSCLPFLQG